MICGGGGKKTHNANTKYNYIIIIYNMPLPAVGRLLCLTGVHQLGEIDVSVRAVRIIPPGTVCIFAMVNILDMITGNARCQSVLCFFGGGDWGWRVERAREYGRPTGEANQIN